MSVLLGCQGQRPRLLSSVPSNSIEPVSQWAWGKLLNGQVYRSKSTFGGGGGKRPAYCLMSDSYSDMLKWPQMAMEEPEEEQVTIKFLEFLGCKEYECQTGSIIIQGLSQ